MGYFKHPQPQWMFDCGFTRWQKEEDGNVRHSPQKLGCNRGIQFQQRTNRYPSVIKHDWLMVWNMTFMTFHILGFNHPNWLLLFRGVGQPPTRWHSIWKSPSWWQAARMASLMRETWPQTFNAAAGRCPWRGSVQSTAGFRWTVKFPNGERWKMWVYSWKLIYDSKVGL